VRLATRFLVVAVPAAAALMLACGSRDGSSGSGPLTLEQYFQQLGAIDKTSQARFERIGQQLSEQQPPEQALSTIKDVYPEEVATLQDLLDGMERLRPPAEVKNEHDAAVDALRTSVKVTEKNAKSIASATLFSQVTDRLNSQESTGASKKTSDTCLALEKAGTDRGLTVDLNC